MDEDICYTTLIMKAALLFALYLCYCDGQERIRVDDVTGNKRPIIGILSQEQHYQYKDKYSKEDYTSYIAASYVKSLESAGAGVVPIMIGKERAYYKDLMEKLNGVLMPGGATYFNQSDGYADAGEHILGIAKEMNNAGDYFPIFATCLGFELLIILESGRGYPENRVACYSFDNRPLHFTEDYSTSKLFGNAPEDIIELLANNDITVNSHQLCILDENLRSHNLTEDWRVTSHSDDENGVEFIASMEHTRYPFYGVQFHPEKVPFEWKEGKNYPNSAEAVKANRYFMDFFVSESRKSNHSFGSHKENEYIIYNYVPQFTGLINNAYNQCYMFEPKGTV